MTRRLLATVLALALAGVSPAAAQTAAPLFAAKGTPSPHPPYSIGAPSRGCLAGAMQLPESGPTWQAMRLGRNHNWGNPATVDFIEDLSRTAATLGWRGLYVGDIGPPPRLDLTRSEREKLGAMIVRSQDQRSLNGNWTSAHSALIEATARDRRVERIFVTAPVKLALCQSAGPGDAGWLRKVRPWWGHHDHFHVRLNCPPGPGCVDPAPVPPGDGCKEAVWWVTDALLPPDPNAPKPKPKPPLRLADLPPQCAEVVTAR